MNLLHVFGRFICCYYTNVNLLDLIEMAMRYSLITL